jgi:O-antigen ligase
MLTLLLFSTIVWIPLAFLGISRRGFLVLLIWLAIAPIATNIAAGRISRLTTGDAPATGAPSSQRNAAESWSDIHQDVRSDEIIRQPTRIVFLLFIMTFLLHSLLKRRSSLSFDRTEILMGIFCLLLLANILLQSDRRPYSLRLATDCFILPFAAYYFARRLVTNEHRFFQLQRVLGYVGVYLIVIGLIERLTSSGLIYRLHGPFRSSTEYYSVLMVIFFAVLLSFVGDRGHENRQKLAVGIKWLVLGLSPVIVLLTWSRGIWVGFLMAVWVFALLGFRLTSRSQRMGWLGVGMALLPLALLALSFSVPEDLIERRILVANTIEWRYLRWMVALEEGMRHPVFGIGFKNLQDVLANQLGSSDSVHNFLLSAFAELGVVGLLSFLIVMTSLSLKGFRLYRKGSSLQDRWCGVVLMAVIVGNIMPSLFANTIEAANLSLVYQYVFLGGIAGLYKEPMSVPSYRAVRPIAKFHEIQKTV